MMSIDSYVDRDAVGSLNACALGTATPQPSDARLRYAEQRNPFVWQHIGRVDRLSRSRDGQLPVDGLRVIHLADRDKEGTWAVVFWTDLMYYRRAL